MEWQALIGFGRGWRRVFLGVAIATLAPACALAEFEPPAGYYATATGTGSTLKQQLHDIIDDHTRIAYTPNRDIMKDLSTDPNDSNRFLLIYDRQSLSKSVSNTIWNREHTWPRSRGVDDTGPDFEDLHHLLPADPGVNEDRLNFNFGGSYGQPYGLSGPYWYPGDADAGLVARAQFYMDTRYNGVNEAQTTDLQLVAGNPGSFNRFMGDLNSLLDWHYAAPPDAFELRRNDLIGDQYQFNRNPFIDHPEWVWSVFVGEANDTRLRLGVGSSDSTGGSTHSIDFGSVLVGAPAPAQQSVSLIKSGLDGTYYEVATSGDATSSLGGRLNAFRPGSAGFTSIMVGLDGSSTATPGLSTGAVTIDNLDITTGGGIDRGANDGDDTINLSLTVLDHATPSLDPAVELASLTIDFGQVEQGAGAVIPYDIYNLETAVGFTSPLELRGISGAGDTSTLTQWPRRLVGEEAIAAGESTIASATLLTDQIGFFSATYTLFLSDIDLPGREFYELTLTMVGEVIAAGLEGDFNGDGTVDVADYTVWRDGLGVDYTIAHYQTWRDNFGESLPDPIVQPASSPAPEPAAAALLLTAFALVAGRGRHA